VPGALGLALGRRHPRRERRADARLQQRLSDADHHPDRHKSCEALSGASQAWLDYWMSASFTNSADTIGVGYIPTGQTGWYGYLFTGSWPAWFHVVLSLKQWYVLGDVGSISCPKVLIQFSSGSSPASGFGVRVDDLTIGPTRRRSSGPRSLRARRAGRLPSASASRRASREPQGPRPTTGTSAIPVARRPRRRTPRSATPRRATTTRVSGSRTPTPRSPHSASTKVHVDPACTLSCTATVPASATAGSNRLLRRHRLGLHGNAHVGVDLRRRADVHLSEPVARLRRGRDVPVDLHDDGGLDPLHQERVDHDHRRHLPPR